MQIEIILGIFIGTLLSVFIVYKYLPYFTFFERRKKREKELEENKKSKSKFDLD